MRNRIAGATIMALFGLLAASSTAAAQQAPTMQVGELLARIEEGTQPVILDVRTREEYAEGHIVGAINIPYDEVADRASELELSLEDELVVYCRSGRRAAAAEATLFELGYTNLKDLEGSVVGWTEAGYPLVTP
jgi:phage shock protein E